MALQDGFLPLPARGLFPRHRLPGCVETVRRALAMDSRQIQEMRAHVAQHYYKHLDFSTFLATLLYPMSRDAGALCAYKKPI
jgi:hypothetical protein